MNQPAVGVINEAPLAWLAYLIAASSALSMLMGMAIFVCFFGPIAWLVVLLIQRSVNGEIGKAHVRRARKAIGTHILLSVVAFGLSAALIFYMAGLSLGSVSMAIDIIELEGIDIIFTEAFWGTVLNDYVSDQTRSGIAVFIMIFGVPILGTLIGCIVGLVSLILLILAMQKLGDGVAP
jgi:hypothetical protein